MRKIIKILRNRKAEGYIDTALSVLLIAMLLVLVINIFSMLMMKQQINHFAEELIEVTTMYGCVGTEAETRLSELKKQTAINPSVTYSGTDFLNGSSRVQLGNRITVTVTATMTLKGLGVFQIPVTLTGKKSGLSQVYWK